LIRHQVVGELLKDFASRHVRISNEDGPFVRRELFACMDLAIQACMEPQHRDQLQEHMRALLEVTSAVEPLCVAAQTPQGVGMALKGSVAVKDPIQKTSVPELEAGIGTDARYAFATLVIQKLIKGTPLEQPFVVRNENDYLTWQGRFADERYGGKGRYFIMDAHESRKLGEIRLAWLRDLHIVVVELVGTARSSLWLLKEHVLIAAVEGFVTDLDALPR
jgi:hypothetical protein